MKNVLHYFKIVIGCAIYALGFDFFIYPNELISGGVTGISTILNYLFGLPVGAMVIVLNIPLFVWGAKKLGLKFIIDSAVGTFALSVMIDFLNHFAFAFTTQPILAAIYGGLITGIGLGIVFAADATTGGTDIIVKILRMKYQFLNIGQLLLILDGIIVAVYAVIFKKLDFAMYSVIYIFICSKVMDEVLYGLNYGKIAFIISDSFEEISRCITEKMGRGVTILKGQGAYTGKEKNVLMCAIKKRQIVDLKNITREIDPNAFIIISDTKEVLGDGFSRNTAEG